MSVYSAFNQDGDYFGSAAHILHLTKLVEAQADVVTGPVTIICPDAGMESSVDVMVYEDGEWRPCVDESEHTRQWQLITEVDAALKANTEVYSAELSRALSYLYPAILRGGVVELYINEDDLFGTIQNVYSHPVKVFVRMFPPEHYLWDFVYIEGVSEDDIDAYRENGEDGQSGMTI